MLVGPHALFRVAGFGALLAALAFVNLLGGQTHTYNTAWVLPPHMLPVPAEISLMLSLRNTSNETLLDGRN